MTKDECIYAIEHITELIENKDKYEQKKHGQYALEIYYNKCCVLSMWYVERSNMYSVIEKSSMDISTNVFWLYNTAQFGSFLEYNSIDDIDALTMQYETIVDTVLIYDLVLATYVHKLLKKYNLHSMLVNTANLLNVKEMVLCQHSAPKNT